MSVAPHCTDPAAFEGWLRDRLAGDRAGGEEGDSRLGRPSWGRGVRLSTVHRVKGLEWPHVIVLSATEGLMPHRLAGDLEEERRVFHVAVTRCSESVLIIADGPKSPFIREMQWRSKLEPAAPAEESAPLHRHDTSEPSRGRRASDTQWWLKSSRGPEPARPAPASKSQSPPIDETAEPEAAAMFERLRRWRLERSRLTACRPSSLLRRHPARVGPPSPHTDEDLLAVPGIGPAKLAAYGDALKSLLADSVRHSRGLRERDLPASGREDQ